MTEIDIHADDYALTVNTSKDMLDCIKAGKLNSISIVPNTSSFGQCMDMMYEAIPSLPFLPLMSVHLDFVEGRSLAGSKEVPLLTRSDSNLMGLSWGGLFKLSYMPWKRGEAKRQLKKEIEAQIESTQKAIDRCRKIAESNGIPCTQKGLRIDSHQHAHMIPVVWEAVTEVVEEEGYSLEYIRNSKEVLGVFVAEKSLWKTYRPINFVKNRLLSLYSHKVDRYDKTHHKEQMYLWGLVMSGHMDHERIQKLYGAMTHKAERDGRVLEILFHPGKVIPEEVNPELGDAAAEDFYLSDDRHVEKSAVMQI
ncbi:MAG: ChbG/HpnK family deacetylase [Lachnospiraceae bacterium]|nr:ChbG/HpnK family deacetylase [Lachnospiraceae bacterium]